LQNPSDPDAGYCDHKGQGYQVQLTETHQDAKPEGEPTNCSDSDALKPAIEETKKRGCAPDELLAESSYGSDDNVQKAAAEGVDLIAPTSGKPKSKESMLILDDFWQDEESG